MAKLYPARLPDRVLNNRKLKGEIETFEALSKLSDDFEVFYNRCPNSGGASRVYERKIDFIIIHEQFGLLAMEVKGGKIRIGADGGFEQYHSNKMKWVSIDPFMQVKLALRELIITIKSDSPKYWIPDDVCVLFPATSRRDLTDTPQCLPAGTLCSDDVPVIKNIIPTLFTKNRQGTAWQRDTFIDVRRRLQNMPEAQGDNRPSDDKSSTTDRFFKSALQAKASVHRVKKTVHSSPTMNKFEDVDDSKQMDDHPMDKIHTTLPKYMINYSPPTPNVSCVTDLMAKNKRGCPR